MRATVGVALLLGCGALVFARADAAGAEPAAAPETPAAAEGPVHRRPTDHLWLTPPEPLRLYLDAHRLHVIKLGLAVSGTALLLWSVALRRWGRDAAFRRTRDLLLVCFGVFALLGYWNWLRFHPVKTLNPLRHVHKWDTFHYFMGAKYFPELGYTGLYECVIAADLEVYPVEELEQRLFRDLETNALISPRDAIRHPERCTDLFSAERWSQFRRDAKWFRGRMGNWTEVTKDWGYNPTPVWGIAGIPLANTGRATVGRIRWLTFLDVPLIAAMWSCVWWFFGWRVLCVALIFWATNFASDYSWTGGSILRKGWIATLLIGICLLRGGRPAIAGFFLGYSALLRVFPALAMVGVLVKASLRMLRERRFVLATAQRRLILGALAAVLVLVPVATLTSGGLGAWVGFVRNSIADSKPVWNLTGLKPAVSYRHDVRVAALRQQGVVDNTLWSRYNENTFAERRALFYGLVVLLSVPIVLALARAEDWVAAVLGVGWMTILFGLSGYYYEALVVFALLSATHPGIGLALCGLAALSRVLGLYFADDELSCWYSLCAVGFVLYSAISVLRTPPRGAPEATEH